MNLDHPDEKLVYEELAPLVKRLNAQQRQISMQRSDLQRKRDEFEAATGHMSEGIILLDETGSILSINTSARKIMGATPSCVGKDILLINNTYDLQDILQHVRNGEHVEKPFSTDMGSYQINASPIFTEDKVTGTVLLLFDISEKEKAERMRREFTANVSHELKTPLHTISGYAELLANNAVKPEDIPAFSQQILSDSRRMSALFTRRRRIGGGASQGAC
jgi:two-component system phosphate regulon sensor histidine kinase PhoR